MFRVVKYQVPAFSVH